MGFVADWLGFDDGSSQIAAAQATAGASVKSAQLAAGIAKENIQVQREGLVLAKEGIDVAKGEQEFQKEQYEDWKSVYGSLQENLSKYYAELDVSDVIAQGLETEQKEFQTATSKLNRTLAQRGLVGSGIDVASHTALASTQAQSRARIRSTAEREVIDRKQGFLGIGLGQGAQLLSVAAQGANTVQSAYSGATSASGLIGQAYGQQVGAYSDLSGRQMQMSGNYLSAGISLVGQRSKFVSSLTGAVIGAAGSKGKPPV